MTQEIIKKTLPIFYTVIFLVFIVGGILLYRIDEEQKNRLLTIEENLDVQAVGENVQLELNDQNKHEQVTYEVDDENVVKVDSEGNLVSVGEGSTEVTIKSKDSDKQQTIIVNVGKEAIKEYKEEQIKNSIISTNNKKTTTNNVKTTTPTDIKKTTIIKDKTTTSSPLSTTISNKKTTTTNKPTTKSQATTTTSNKATTNKSSTTSQPTTTKPSSGGSSKPSNVNKNIAVTGVSLNQVLGQIHLNTNSKTLTLVANISPSNATNKKIIWTSGNENIATVSNGVVTAKNPGVVTITARTEDGGKVASAQITVKKNVIIVIGASQVTRMAWYKNSYSSARYNYNTADNTLVYIHKGSSGIDYQTSEGFNIAKDYISNVSKTGKTQVKFYIFFPLSGNTIKNFTCSEISKENATMKNYVKNYNNAIKELANNGFDVKGYVVSMHPVRVSQATNNNYVVTNQNENSCTKNYRSNRKYYRFNRATKNILNEMNTSYLKYESIFSQIMEVPSDIDKNYSYKKTYNTTDGVHWNDSTTQMYVDMMLNYSGDL